MQYKRKSIGGEILSSPIFDDYHRSRLTFLHSIADVACVPDAIVGLRSSGVVALCCPLIFDPSPTVQQGALLALGQLANHSKEMAQEMVSRNILPLTIKKFIRQVKSLRHEEDKTDDYQLNKRLTIFLFRSVSKHCTELAKVVVDCNLLKLLPLCLEDEDDMIKRSAICTLANIAKHNEELAMEVASEKHGLLKLLLQVLTCCDLSLVGVASLPIYEMAKFAGVVEILLQHDIIRILSKLLQLPDDDVKNIALSTLARISTHSKELAETTGKETPSVSFALQMLKDEHLERNKTGIAYLFQCTKYDSELMEVIARENGIPKIIDYLKACEMTELKPILLVISNLACRGGVIASHLIHEGIRQLARLLESDSGATLEIKGMVVGIIGILGSYGPGHANSIAEANIVDTIASLCTSPSTHPNLRTKCKHAFSKIMKECTHLPKLEALLDYDSTFVMEQVLSQYSKILVTDGETRKWFVSSGWLKKLQEMKPQSGPSLQQLIGHINKCFPQDVVDLYSPSNVEDVLGKIEKYNISRTSLPHYVSDASVNSSDWSLIVNTSYINADSRHSEATDSKADLSTVKSARA